MALLKPSALMLMTLVTISAASGQAGPPEAGPALEHDVKAAFVYNFAKFVEWPVSTAANGDSSSLVVGVIGNERFASALEQTIRGKSVNGHPVVVRRAGSPAELKLCHIAFIGLTEKKRIGEILTALKDSAVLTVGEVPQFTRWGGIINFIEEDSKIRFEVNPDAAARSGIKISSRLLQLARVVRDQPGDR